MRVFHRETKGARIVLLGARPREGWILIANYNTPYPLPFCIRSLSQLYCVWY